MPHRHARLHVAARRDWGNLGGAVEGAWNQINPFQRAATPQTIYKTVYTTMTPDNWDGTAAGWTTLPPSKSDAADPAAVTASETIKPATVVAAATEGTLLLAGPSSLPSSLIPTTASSVATSLALATDSPTLATQTFPSPSVTAEASATATGKAGSGGGGTSAAAKAGIAIGVLAGLLVVFSLVYFLFSGRRKQIQKQRLDDDEKINGPFSDRNEIPRTAATAPRLSLRPVTQFLPGLGVQQHPDRRASRGAAIAMVPSPAITRPAGSSAWDGPVAGASTDRANPFGSSAERVGDRLAPTTSRSQEAAVGVAATTNSLPDASPAATAVAADPLLTRKTSVRRDAPKPLDLTLPPSLSPVPPSPAGTEFSVHSVSPGQSPGPSTSAAAIAAAGGPAASTVHRVQLDFKPTLEDEMDLKAGQLVRLLHEYDDGWALCIRLDRSQQGVVPRTCLSTRPVKPRPTQGVPRGPPVNPQRGPNYPSAQRPMTPQGPPMHPRPASPAGAMGGRPKSPSTRNHLGPPQSPGSAGRMMAPPGPSAMRAEYWADPSGLDRKPVPGQAY